MNLEKSLIVLNRMVADGVFSHYAIGGAVAAFFYVEPATTFDLDVFIAWEPASGGIISPAPVYGYLAEHGYSTYEREAVVIEGWPVQFLPLGNDLIKEALAESVPFEIGGVPTRIFTQEHLMAICLQVGRPKDLARLVQFMEEGSPDMDLFREILHRHELGPKWDRFGKRFGPDAL